MVNKEEHNECSVRIVWSIWCSVPVQTFVDRWHVGNALIVIDP